MMNRTFFMSVLLVFLFQSLSNLLSAQEGESTGKKGVDNYPISVELLDGSVINYQSITIDYQLNRLNCISPDGEKQVNYAMDSLKSAIIGISECDTCYPMQVIFTYPKESPVIKDKWNWKADGQGHAIVILNNGENQILKVSYNSTLGGGNGMPVYNPLIKAGDEIIEFPSVFNYNKQTDELLLKYFSDCPLIIEQFVGENKVLKSWLDEVQQMYMANYYHDFDVNAQGNHE